VNIIMPKQNKFARHEAIDLHSAEDPDELQSLDERDSHWVEAWKNAAKESTELKTQLIIPDKMRLTARSRKNPTLANRALKHSLE
jgi:hypothetical protein